MVILFSFKVPKQRSDHVVKHCVEEKQHNEDKYGQNFGKDNLALALLSTLLLSLIVTSKSVKCPQQAQKDDQDCHLVE